MTNALNFPVVDAPEIIDERHFEQFADASLLLTCYERVKAALDIIDDGEKIEVEDETHIILMETCLALSVLFRRKTGGDAAKVSADHWEVMRRHLLAGQEPPDMHIPIDDPQVSALHPSHFEKQTTLALACMAFNSSERVREAINSTLVAANALITSNAAIEAINVDTALRQLVLRLSGGSLESMAAHIGRKPGETLQ